jgi:hypothetical protein
MADESHIARLREGVAAWNEWRRTHPEVIPDLSAGVLRGLDLSTADLSDSDLRGADLRGVQLQRAKLVRARMNQANLFKAVLDGADLEDAVLIGAQFLNCAATCCREQLVFGAPRSVSRLWCGNSRKRAMIRVAARVGGRLRPTPDEASDSSI